jgi:hypothetical protein
MAEPEDDIGTPDADRQQVVDHLRRHMTAERMGFEDYGIEPVAADRPVVTPPLSSQVATGRRVARPSADLMSIPAFRVHLFLWLVFSAFWLVIWLGSVMATGGWVPFWPVFPIAAFGLSVGIHAAVRKGLSP